MATTTYTAAQLYGNNGEGTSSINLSASVQYLFTIDSTSGSSYFTMETVRDYTGTTPRNTSGSYFSNAIPTRVNDDYIAGFALKQHHIIHLLLLRLLMLLVQL
jgi:hypothetical protein